MRVVSLVPSWTETLLEAGADVVGRTRFCIHPHSKVSAVPRVGGTKDWDLPRIQALKPDLLILDKEENPRFMAEAGLPFWASHITGVEAVAPALRDLAERTGLPKLSNLAAQWAALPAVHREWKIAMDLPGLIEWGRQPTGTIDKIVYVIWKDPWMRAGANTFIGSMLGRCGLSGLLDQGTEKYPKFDPSGYDPATTLLLFSSEPYPFLKRKAEVAELGFAHAFVDGESFSWFGVRSLRFLERVLSHSYAG